jgi:hypothetical protein
VHGMGLMMTACALVEHLEEWTCHLLQWDSLVEEQAWDGDQEVSSKCHGTFTYRCQVSY